MGRADSPLRERAIFIDGAPRSGTTWLVRLLAMHPEIAGVQAESHLFDFGVDRLFDNFEGVDPNLRGLYSFVTRDQLVDVARDACDGILMAMRENVARGAEPRFVVEKTPTGARTDGRDLERKRECYPDAWYLHIVRDRESVVRSLMRSPFMADRSRETCEGLYDRVVGGIRRVLGDAPHYRELPYEHLRDDPAEACAEVFGWLGLEAGEDVRDVIRNLAPERVSELGVVADSASPSTREMLRAVVRRPLQRLQAKPPAAAPESMVVFRLMAALHDRDVDTLRELVSPKLEFVYRGPDGDRWLEGEVGIGGLAELAEKAFDRKHSGGWQGSAGGGPGEFWTSEPGRPFCSLFLSRVSGDATRVDLAIGLVLEDERIRRMVVVSAGPPTGRPLDLTAAQS